MKWYTIGVVIILLLLCLGLLTHSVLAQTGGRDIRLTVFLDYAHPQAGSDGTVIFDGTVNSTSGAGLDLQGLGFVDEYGGQLKMDEERSSVRGLIRAAVLIFPQKDQEDGWYHLQLGPLTLSPDDNLTLILPFVNLDYAQIKPPPNNLSELEAQSTNQPAVPPTLYELSYSGGTANGVEFDIPFRPIQKKIDLTITPLVGEMLFVPSPSFRLSGRVVFDRVFDYREFRWDCPTDPAMQIYRYNVSNLLFGLDSPPGLITAGMLSSLYQNKPTYTFLRMDPSLCSFDAQKGGQIELDFNGQTFNRNGSTFPKNWDDTSESNLPNGSNPREYILEMGDIVLAPGDVLTVTIPGVNVHQLDPPPARMQSSNGVANEFIYEGPLYSRLQIIYEPEAGLILSQLNSAARVGTREIEQSLGPAWGGNSAAASQGSHLAIWVGVFAVILYAAGARLKNSESGFFIKTAAWALLVLALFFGLRSVYGFYIAGMLVFINAGSSRQSSHAYWLRGAAGIILILGAMLLDQLASARLFQVLRVLELEVTPITPLILFLLSLGLAILIVVPLKMSIPLFPEVVLALVLVLIPITFFDAIQKSFISLAILGIGIGYIYVRMVKIPQVMASHEVIARLKLAGNNPLMIIGFILLVLFAAQNGLQSTNAVLSSIPAILRALLAPFLLFISIVANFLAAGLLFIILYPILPFRAGYFKAAAFGLFLVLIFLFGIGADENLASTWQTLILGRLIFYSGVPLLVGLFFDIAPKGESPTGAGEETAALDIRQTANLVSERLKNLRSLLNTIGAIATLVAPGIYAYFSHVPLLMNYFDLIETLLHVTASS